ncbi:MAG: 4-hydroxybutyrate--acetyl-CoA CoA transferase [Anaerolineaceae bacterium]|nr:4-hydroxybutyrate--acetyl-CoA CoA transferase [Anaerolineaceae bacterium]
MGRTATYAEKLITIPEAVAMVKSNMRIGTAIAASEPTGLLTELANQKERLFDVHTWVCLPMRAYEYAMNPEMAEHFFVDNWFYGVNDRKVHSQGRMSYIPNNLHRAATDKLYASGGKLDVFWGTATPPDERGFMSLSLSLVVEKELLKAADLVVLEINENLPWTLGDTQVHISEVDYVVENHIPLFELPSEPSSEVELKIGEYVASLIEDGSTLQLGIGGIPNAITSSLVDRKELGIHTEMFNDGMVDLYEAGAVTNSKKSIYKGKMVGAFALGSKKLYDFLNNNIGVELLQGRVTNDPYVIGQNYKMISVNTALQVDVMGQVCSQSIGYRHFSGTGGQLDTHRGAQLSEGGRGIIALRSTAKKGQISTIVPILSAGSEVTVPSQCVDTVVTEYGIAELRGRSLRERAAALIKITHPDFRDQLWEEVEKLGIVPKVIVPGISFVS